MDSNELSFRLAAIGGVRQGNRKGEIPLFFATAIFVVAVVKTKTLMYVCLQL